MQHEAASSDWQAGLITPWPHLQQALPDGSIVEPDEVHRGTKGGVTAVVTLACAVKLS